MEYKMRHLAISMLMILYANYLMISFAPFGAAGILLTNMILGGCLGFSYTMQGEPISA